MFEIVTGINLSQLQRCSSPNFRSYCPDNSYSADATAHEDRTERTSRRSAVSMLCFVRRRKLLDYMERKEFEFLTVGSSRRLD
jgi:hypothetical protein